MGDILRARLAPFRHRNFTLFFLAQTLSLIGTWSHDLARSWIVVEATSSSGALGTLNTAVAIPVLFLILQGGVLVDRTDVRKLIQWTKTLMGLIGITMAFMSEFAELHFWHLLVFAVVEGLITSFDSPAYQALIVRMVPRTDFQQALALNSTNFHASRMLGPVVAAWLMTLHGPSLVFLFDGISYFLVALVLSRVTTLNGPPPRVTTQRGPALLEGLRYVYEDRALRFRILQLLLAIGCVHPMMMVVFRVYVQKKFNLDAHAFGEVFSFPALGSMCGALIFAVVKPERPVRALYVGVPAVFVALLVMPWMPTLALTVGVMTVAGFSLYLTFASLTLSMQLDVQDAYRGRLSSLIGMGFASIGPLMSFPWGHMADLVGPPRAIVTSALVFGSVSAYLAWSYSRFEKAALKGQTLKTASKADQAPPTEASP